MGTVRNITRSITVPANGTASFAASAAALPAPHMFRGIDIANAGVDLVAFTVSGFHSRVVQPSDNVCAVFANSTAAPITTNVTVSLVELGALPTT